MDRKKLCSLGLCFILLLASPINASHLPSVTNSYVIQNQLINRIYASIPRDVKAIEVFTEQALQQFEAEMAHFIAIPDRTFENTIRGWHELIATTQAKRFIVGLTADEATKEPAEQAALRIWSRIQAAMRDPMIAEIMVIFAENHLDLTSLSPSERMQVYYLMTTIDLKAIPENLVERVIDIKEKMSSQPMTLFTFLQGEAPEKTGENGSFSVFNLNTCCFWGLLPMLWGGPLPWELRIDGIAQQIKEQDPDVICLQEMFDEKASAALFEKLKDRYRYFYIGIGARNYGLHESTLGISSGLFIASKYTIDKAEFIPFGENSPPERSYGFFRIDCLSQGQHIGTVITTHLQPFETEEGRIWRLRQINQIVDYIQSQLPEESPSILCGDLNTEWNGKDPAEEVIKHHFINGLLEPKEKASFEKHTCLELSHYWWVAKRDIKKFSTKPEIVDYCLLFNTVEENSFSLKTKIIPMNDPSNPEQALSDHHGLMTHIWKNPQ